MLHKIITAYNGTLPEHIKVCFANTGKEMPQTLDFVDRCSKEWGVEIVWLERFAEAIPIADRTGRSKYTYTTKVVTYEAASRKGEPFRALILSRRYMPNPVARFCTVDLKIRAIREYMESIGAESPFLAFIGIRADEERRAAKMHGKVESGQECYLPLWLDGITKADVGAFWKAQPFDLELPNNNGTTDWGNCDLCFLKGLDKKMTIIRDRPELADWWIELELELELSGVIGKGAYFRADQPSYKDMKIIATSQNTMDFGSSETIPCFCGE
jgi:3'-phosphoadenosine 5'-phosphosulfate sulfotransferase (PAPS reductase)/FAD synthetase